MLEVVAVTAGIYYDKLLRVYNPLNMLHERIITVTNTLRLVISSSFSMTLLSMLVKHLKNYV